MSGNRTFLFYKALSELSEAIKAQLDYRAFYARYCHKARGHGARLRALCPIPGHKHSGLGQHSLSLDCRRGLWHCFSRDEGGDAITFYELMHGVSFARARIARTVLEVEGRDQQQINDVVVLARPGEKKRTSCLAANRDQFRMLHMKPPAVRH